MSNVLVTGGLGFIGSHTIIELVAKGYEPVIVDNLYNSTLDTLESLNRITGTELIFQEIDLIEFPLVKNVFKQYDFDSVIHFAAYKAVEESVRNPLEYYRNNLDSLINLLDLCREFSVNNFIFSSSCTVYGQPDILPVNENSVKQAAESPYGNTKQIGEEIIEDFCKANPRFKAISLRYFNPVGAHESSLIGELPLGVPNNLIPFITQTAMGIHEQLKIFGGDYDTPDGTCIRDYIHVVDLALAHIRSMEYSISMKKNYDVFNIGTGKGNSVLEVIQVFEKASGKKLNYQIIDRRPGDIAKIYADPTKSFKLLNWRPRYTLYDMMKSSWNWQLALGSKRMKLFSLVFLFFT